MLDAMAAIRVRPLLEHPFIRLQNHIDRISIEKLNNVIQAVSERAESRINSFAKVHSLAKKNGRFANRSEKPMRRPSPTRNTGVVLTDPSWPP